MANLIDPWAQINEVSAQKWDYVNRLSVGLGDMVKAKITLAQLSKDEALIKEGKDPYSDTPGEPLDEEKGTALLKEIEGKKSKLLLQFEEGKEVAKYASPFGGLREMGIVKSKNRREDLLLERERLEKEAEKKEKFAREDKEIERKQGYTALNAAMDLSAKGRYEDAQAMMEANLSTIKATYPSLNIDMYLDSAEELAKDTKLITEFDTTMKTFNPMKPEDRSKAIDFIVRANERPNLDSYVKILSEAVGKGFEAEVKPDKPETESQYKAKILEKGAKDYKSLTPGERKIFDKEVYITPIKEDKSKEERPITVKEALDKISDLEQKKDKLIAEKSLPLWQRKNMAPEQVKAWDENANMSASVQAIDKELEFYRAMLEKAKKPTSFSSDVLEGLEPGDPNKNWSIFGY